MDTFMQKDTKVLDRIKEVCRSPLAYKEHTVQSLWSGYGEIARFNLGPGKGSCIGKHVNKDAIASHPRGWDTEHSHQRKLSSYHNEQAFYSNLACHTHYKCRVPSLIDTGVSERSLWIIMEDLDAVGYDMRHQSADSTIARQCISWLAHFHAEYLDKDTSSAWPIGTYWHLATRQDEWMKMPETALKDAAHQIDVKLQTAQYQTLLHGDAKLANFCFSSREDSVAAVDFQYVGKGCGVRDLVYLLGSCFSNKQLEKHSVAMIDLYFFILQQALNERLSYAQFQELELEWRSLIPFAWADFERFLQGWSPGHHKLNAYSKAQTDLAISSISL
jgi:aminoglycoside phosphotransferase (APT) family kinase protein